MNLIYETLWTGEESDLLISILENSTESRLTIRTKSIKNICTINMKMNGIVLEEKSPFKMLGMSFSSKLDWGSHIFSIAQTVFKKIGALIRPMKLLSPEVALYLFKSTI